MADITIIDHGQWEPYQPDPLPAWAQMPGVLGRVAFARRLSDGQDWYEYLKTKPFPSTSIVATVLLDPSNSVETVKAVFRDPTMIFPHSQRVIEIVGHDVDDDKPHNEFAWMTYDPATKTLGDPLPQPIISVHDYQFAGQAAAEKIITDDDADKWVTTGVIPERLVAAVQQAVPDAERQRRVLLFLKGTTVFPRFHELTPLLAASFGKDTPAKVDAFFEAASKR